MADVFDSIGSLVLAGSKVAMCTSCGGYAWGGIQSLCKPCSPPTYALKRQRGRMQKGLFPCWSLQYKGWVIGPMRKPTAAELFHLAKRTLPNPIPNFEGSHTGRPAQGGWSESWSEQELLARFGLNQELLETLVGQLKARSRGSDSDSD